MRISVTLLALLSLTSAAAAQSSLPDTENGRYALSQTANGVLRLDTRTGTLSTCKPDTTGWSCVEAADERAALDKEIGRLQAENDRLRTQLAARDDKTQDRVDEALPKSDPLSPSMPRSADGQRKIEIPLPSDQDVNRFVGFLESAWRRLVEMTGRVQRDADGKI
jgi:hypothetical protein